jgi:hypothetical protein
VHTPEAGAAADLNQQIVDCLARELATPLGEKEPGRSIVAAGSQIAFECPHGFAIYRMWNREAMLQSLECETMLLKVGVAAPQADGFAHSEPVPVHESDQGIIAE